MQGHLGKRNSGQRHTLQREYSQPTGGRKGRAHDGWIHSSHRHSRLRKVSLRDTKQGRWSKQGSILYVRGAIKNSKLSERFISAGNTMDSGESTTEKGRHRSRGHGSFSLLAHPRVREGQCGPGRGRRGKEERRNVVIQLSTAAFKYLSSVLKLELPPSPYGPQATSLHPNPKGART